MRTARVLLLVAVVAALVGVSSPVLADCVQPTAPELLDLAAEEDRSVFVGSVLLGGDAHLARLSVEEVWSGPDLAPEVLVRTGPKQLPWPVSELGARRSSVDADLMLGERYLIGTRDDFATDICSSMIASADVLIAAPPETRPPTPDGFSGHQLGLFDTALGATLLTSALGIAALAWWGRRHDRRGPVDGASPGRAAAYGALVGTVVGIVGAGIVELARTATLQLFPTDVVIVGFGLVFGTPASVVVGALAWWRDRPASTAVRLVLVALPVVLAGAVQVVFQWSAQ